MLALRSNEIVGVAMLARPRKIVLLHVEPAARLSRIGSALLNALEERASKTGSSILWVTSTIAARAFYERHGYAVTGPANTVFGPALSMTKRLKVGNCGAASQERQFAHGLAQEY